MRIGLEIHIRLNTEKKLFSRASNDVLGLENSRIDFYDLGLPGSMPRLNHQAVIKALQLATNLNFKIPQKISFDRKHYRYPDLPLGFQLTQQENPVGKEGLFPMDNKSLKLSQLHLEMDAAKTSREGSNWNIDYNRCGVPLIEVVTAPDLHSSEEMYSFLKAFRTLCISLNISTCDLSKGDMRFDVNVSTEESVRQEIKNLNSFNFARQAVSSLVSQLKAHPLSTSWTWSWDLPSSKVVKSREKKGEEYLYLREYDLPILKIKDENIEKASQMNFSALKKWNALKQLFTEEGNLEKIYLAMSKLKVETGSVDFFNIAKVLSHSPINPSEGMRRALEFKEELTNRESLKIAKGEALDNFKEASLKDLTELFSLEESKDLKERIIFGENKALRALIGIGAKKGFEPKALEKLIRDEFWEKNC